MKTVQRMSILTEQEKTAVISMARYWDEVAQRDDISPLYAELQMIVNKLGIKLLWIVAEHAKQE